MCQTTAFRSNIIVTIVICVQGKGIILKYLNCEGIYQISKTSVEQHLI